MTSQRSGEIVPLADRLRYMRWLRGLMVIGAVLVAGQAGEAALVGLRTMVVGSGAYLLFVLVGELVWHRVRGRGIYLFGLLLIGDGVYLAWATYVSGGTLSPARYLVLVHLIAVTLLASYRTGLKLALWHSLLLLTSYQLQEAEVVTRTFADTVGDELHRLVAFVATFWMVALVTAGASAGNERELRRRRVDLEALAAMADRIERATSPEALARTLLASVADNFQFDRCVLVAGHGRLRVLAVHQIDAAPVDEVKLREGSVLRAVYDQRAPYLATHLDPQADPELAPLFDGARNLIVAPLLADDRPIGAVVVEHGLRHGSRAEQRTVVTLQRFVAHASLALRNAWLTADVQALARIDDLTGIPNRRVFEETLDAELARTRRAGDPVGLLLIDIDRFKRLNDTHGHQAGDEVLRGVAAAMLESCREVDTLARYGGEEFGLILPGADRDETLLVAERLREAVTSAPIPLPVTVSVGVALAPTHGTEAGTLVAAADVALYASKQRGRDRVTLADETTAAARPA